MNYTVESTLWILGNNTKDRVRIRNILLKEIRNIVLQPYGFTASLEGMLVIIKE